MVLNSKVLARPNTILDVTFSATDGTLAWGAHSYVSKMLNNYETMFKTKPKELKMIILRLIPLLCLMHLARSTINHKLDLSSG
jgi:hypothetical protein